MSCYSLSGVSMGTQVISAGCGSSVSYSFGSSCSNPSIISSSCSNSVSVYSSCSGSQAVGSYSAANSSCSGSSVYGLGSSCNNAYAGSYSCSGSSCSKPSVDATESLNAIMHSVEFAALLKDANPNEDVETILDSDIKDAVDKLMQANDLDTADIDLLEDIINEAAGMGVDGFLQDVVDHFGVANQIKVEVANDNTSADNDVIDAKVEVQVLELEEDEAIDLSVIETEEVNDVPSLTSVVMALATIDDKDVADVAKEDEVEYDADADFFEMADDIITGLDEIIDSIEMMVA